MEKMIQYQKHALLQASVNRPLLAIDYSYCSGASDLSSAPPPTWRGGSASALDII